MDKEIVTQKFRKFVENYCYAELVENVKKGWQFIVIKHSDLSKYDYKLSEEIFDAPDEHIKCFEKAIEEFDIPGAKYPIRVRIAGLPKSQVIEIRNVRSKHLGKMICVEGLIRQASDIRPKITLGTFSCPSCGTQIEVVQDGDRFNTPEKCKCGRKGQFNLVDKKLTDVQRIIVEESPESVSSDPKRMSVILSDDLLEPSFEKRRNPGNKITATGILKEIPVYSSHGSRTTRFDLMIEANYVETIEEEFEEIQVSPEEALEINKLSKDPEIYGKLTRSIAPSIWGYDNVKEAIVLQLFGGIRKERKDGTSSRGDVHLLLVGDPGAGKSEMLRYVATLAPKARYVVGRSTTGAGITASVVKDEFTGGWALEAGALVLADKGILCLDEMDKMEKEDRSAMHSAMEQQIISISKANIQATLNARTTILAAANPKFGRFDPYSPIPSQIDLPATLINRFDLIFPIRDVPDRVQDERIATHTLNLHKVGGDIVQEVDSKILKKYIAYARQQCNPKLTDAAIDEIKTFYITLRNSAIKEGAVATSIPISARQLQALVRLAEASARVRLSPKVLKADAKRAIDLLRSCMQAVGTDPETGQFDIDRITTGITATQRSQISIARQIMNDLSEKAGGGKPISVNELLDAMNAQGIDRQKASEIIEALKSKGDVFEPKPGFLQKVG